MTAGNSIDRLNDDDYPAYTMGRAAEILGATPAFLRAIGEARVITPLRSEGGHRRYSRYQLKIAARVRELVDQGTPVEAACRIVILEDQLDEAQRINEELRNSPLTARRTPDRAVPRSATAPVLRAPMSEGHTGDPAEGGDGRRLAPTAMFTSVAARSETVSGSLRPGPGRTEAARPRSFAPCASGPLRAPTGSSAISSLGR